MKNTTIIVPCYNEAERLDIALFQELLDTDGISLLFVDDGSRDDTLTILQGFADSNSKVSVLPLSPNVGKGEAVRQGMLEALKRKPNWIGFIDADMATPSDQVLRLTWRCETEDFDVIIGSRIAYLGSEIHRKLSRHLLGRVFASAASLTLSQRIYDTQCGAKFFRCTDVFKNVVSEPFHSRWAFDVELLGRLLTDGAEILEVPLRRWVDVPGSKIGFKSMLKAGVDLVQIRRQLGKRR